MDFPENNSLQSALEKAAAQARLAQAALPDNLNEDWRFGHPRKHAAALAELLCSQSANTGKVSVLAPPGVSLELDDDTRECEELMATIGSDALLALHLKRYGKGIAIFLDEGMELEGPIVITYETDGLFTPSTSILAAPGAKARIIERHICRGAATLFCTRSVQVMQGAELSLELQEIGSGQSRAMNISCLSVMSGRLRQLAASSRHLWAREETTAEILESADNRADVQLYSANRLAGHETLDQHTRQIHRVGAAASNLLYKNVLDDNATAVFAGNIFVAPGAHGTDAYQANRNMMLSEKASVHSLPGLEILADHVRCSHGSATAPMDREQLFYLLSRGIPRHDAQLLVADGFLEDAISRFKAQ